MRDAEKVPLESVCTAIIDCLHSNPIYSERGIPTLRSPDVGWGELFLERALTTDPTAFDRRTRRGTLEPGDMILVREGGGTGKAGLIQEGQVASLGQRVMQLRPDQEKVLPRFLLHQWLSPIIQQDRIAAGMKGSASPHLNISSLRTFPFLLPSKHRQEMVVRVLDDLLTKDAQLQSIRKRLDTEIDVLLSSILDHAFRGQL